jgi:4-amino-4-deoxy-L-arabinose transferase-like glycosyltransferase
MPETTGAGAATPTVERGRARRWLAVALAAGLALRLAFGLGYWVDQPLTLDEQEYLLLANNVARGRGFSYESPASGVVEGRHVGRAPLYPLLLAGVGLAWSGSTIVADRLPNAVPAEVKVTQALIGCAIVWLIAWWARRVAGPRAGVVAALVAACYPPLVVIGAYALSESLYAALALLAALLLDRAFAAARPRATVGLGLAGGAAIGLAALTRPAILPFLGLAVLWLLIRRRGWLAVAVIAGTALVITPWTARNHAVHGRFVLVASEGGVTFWTGNNRLARGEGDLAANLEMKRAALEIERAAGAATPEALESVFYRAALDDIRADPARFVGLIARKAFYTVVPVGPSYALHSARYVAASVVPYLAVLPWAVWGAWRVRGARQRPVALWLLAAAAWLVCIIFFPQERFRVPVIDPVMIVYAAACAPAAWALSSADARRP